MRPLSEGKGVFIFTATSMASSNGSRTEKKKKTKNGDTSKPVSKARKKRDSEKKENKEKKKKKLNLINGNVKQQHDEAPIDPCSSSEFQEEEHEEDNTVVTNGETGTTKPKKAKRKQEEHEEEEDAKTHAFPMNRIRTMIKGEDPDLRVSQEAVLALNKAAEKFLEQFTQDAYTCCVQERKKSLSYRHLAYVVSKQRRYDFLSDFVPGKVKAGDALRERNSGGNGRG